MSVDLYKKVAIEVVSRLKNKSNAVICITSSQSVVDTLDCAKQLTEAFMTMDLKVNLVNAMVNGIEASAKTKSTKSTDEKLSEFSYEGKNDAKITSLSAKNDIDEIKSTANITVIALDNIACSAPSMMFASCCDGVLLAERKNLSRTDKIDKTLEAINNICVKPLGFILV